MIEKTTQLSSIQICLSSALFYPGIAQEYPNTVFLKYANGGEKSISFLDWAKRGVRLLVTLMKQARMYIVTSQSYTTECWIEYINKH